MSRHYSPRSFLRHVPLHLLREFFRAQGLLQDVAWDALADQEIEPVYQAWQALPPQQREAAEAGFRDVHELACREGIQALIAEAKQQGFDPFAVWQDCAGYHEQAMLAYLRFGPAFTNASLFYHVDRLPSRYWKRRANLPRVTPREPLLARIELQSALSAYFVRAQGRGQRCTVESQVREQRTHYYFSFPDDYAQNHIAHDSITGRLRRFPHRPTFEVVFVYNPDAGTLDLFAQGGREVQRDLETLFGQIVLCQDLGPEPARPPYELNGLKSRYFTFPTDPDDDIQEVRIRQLRLSTLGKYKRRLTLEADVFADVDDIYDLMADYLNHEGLPESEYHVTQATFRIGFKQSGEDERKSLQFDVTNKSCNLKSLREEYRKLGEKYLRRWGIDRA